jgi:hypothetical protein
MQPASNDSIGAAGVLVMVFLGFLLGLIAMRQRYKRVIGALKAGSVNISYSAQVYQAFGYAPERAAPIEGVPSSRYFPPPQEQLFVVPRYRQLEGGDR